MPLIIIMHHDSHILLFRVISLPACPILALLHLTFLLLLAFIFQIFTYPRSQCSYGPSRVVQCAVNVTSKGIPWAIHRPGILERQASNTTWGTHTMYEDKQGNVETTERTHPGLPHKLCSPHLLAMWVSWTLDCNSDAVTSQNSIISRKPV